MAGRLATAPIDDIGAPKQDFRVNVPPKDESWRVNLPKRYAPLLCSQLFGFTRQVFLMGRIWVRLS